MGTNRGNLAFQYQEEKEKECVPKKDDGDGRAVAVMVSIFTVCFEVFLDQLAVDQYFLVFLI